MEIIFTNEREIDFEKIFSLYVDAGWTAYTAKPGILKQAIENSLFLMSAWNGQQLIGFLRAVGDGLTIIYIQDIIVLENFRRKGIGKELITRTLERFKNVRQILLLTDVNQDKISFYENAGFQQTKNLKLTAFIKFNKEET